MSEVRANTISAADGTSPVTLTKQDPLKMWCEQETALPTIRDSFNVSSATDDGVGLSTISYINVFASVNYWKQVSGANTWVAVGVVNGTLSASKLEARWRDGGGTARDPDPSGSSSAAGDLA